MEKMVSVMAHGNHNGISISASDSKLTSRDNSKAKI